MWEYFIYVFLVFIPIAAVMFYILKKNNLSLPNILAIIVLSFIIIITFPVSVTKIGTLATIALYCIILAGLSLYLLQSDADYSLEAEPADKNVLDMRFNPVQESGSNSIKIGDTVLVSDIACKYDSEAGKDMAQADGEAEGKEWEEEIKAGKSEKVDDIEKFKENIGAEIDKQEILSAANLLPEMMEENEEIKMLPQDNFLDSEESLDEIAAFILDAAEKEQAMIMEDEAEKGQDVEKSEMKQEDDIRIHEENHGFKTDNAEDEEIINILDRGFAAKMVSDFQAAFEYFYAAWNLTRDVELKYMLTAELAELSKILGWYSQGEEILVKFIDETFLSNEMKKEAERMLMSIQLIEQEIQRLNLKEVPFSKLPRLVKVKVEEEMRRLYI